MTSEYKTKHSLESRRSEAQRVRGRFPDRIPCIIEKNSHTKNTLGNLDRAKFLIPYDLTMSQVTVLIRRRLKLRDVDSIFLFAGNQLPGGTALLSQIDKQYQNEQKAEEKDGFLYLTYMNEATFGGLQSAYVSCRTTGNTVTA